MNNWKERQNKRIEEAYTELRKNIIGQSYDDLIEVGMIDPKENVMAKIIRENKDLENDKAAELFDLYNAQPGINDEWEWMAKYIKDIKGDLASRLERIRIEIINLRDTQEEKYHVWKFEIVKLINELKEDS